MCYPFGRKHGRHRAVKRREFITLLGSAAAGWPLAARAQQAAKLPTIGLVGGAIPSTQGVWIAALVQRLRELGWLENRTVAIEVRWAEGRNERYSEIVAEFVRLKGRCHCHPGNPSHNCGKAGDISNPDSADALYVASDPLLNSNRVRINSLALGARVPTMHGLREYVEAGGLMFNETKTPDLFRRAAEYVDKILRGANPADLPVEQPTKFDLTVNLTTARLLGLQIPEAFLLRADEVIE